MTAPTAPVSVVVRRHVRPGREADYEAWLDRLTKGVAERFDGYRGAEFHRPAPGGAYRSVFRFDTLDHFDAFERSDFRARMLDEAAPFFAADAVWDRMTGLEFWFDPPPGTKLPQPSPHRLWPACPPGWPPGVPYRVWVTFDRVVGRSGSRPLASATRRITG